LLTHIESESFSSFAPMKSWLRLWNLKRRLALVVIVLDEQVGLFKRSASLKGSESGGGHSPLGSSLLSW